LVFRAGLVGVSAILILFSGKEMKDSSYLGTRPVEPDEVTSATFRLVNPAAWNLTIFDQYV